MQPLRATSYKIYLAREFILWLIFTRTDHSSFVWTLITVSITINLILTLFDVPPDIFTETALLIWLTSASTNPFFINVDSTRSIVDAGSFYLVVFFCKFVFSFARNN